MSHPKSIAIIGAGQAGLQAAQSLRRLGYDGRIDLIGAEPYPPYQRPPLSKTFFTGEMTQDRLMLQADAGYEKLAITTHFGVAASALDVGRRRIDIADGGVIEFDKALIASGARARSLPVAGADLDGVFLLRALDDVKAIRAKLRADQKVCIIGGGYIGLEVAASARMIGCGVCLVEALPRLLGRSVGSEISEFFHRLHLDNGVAIHLGTSLDRIERSGAMLVSVTSAGPIEADIVIIGVGAIANVELASEAGIAVDREILVDEFCQSSAPGIFAAGDCTNYPSKRYGRRVHLESVQNAIDQAKAAAGAMLGKGQPYDPVPWFWSDQYDKKLQIAGLGEGYDSFICRGSPDDDGFSVAYLKQDELIAIDAVNRPRDHMMGRRLLPGRPQILSRPNLANPSLELTAALVAEGGSPCG